MTNKYLHLIFFILSITFCNLIYGQNAQVDSLLQLLEQSISETKKEKIHLKLSKVLERTDISKSKEYATLAQSSSNDSIKSEALNQIGRALFYQNNLDSAEVNFQQSIDILKKLGYQNQAASVGISLGAVQLRKGEYKNAVETLLTGAIYFESISDSMNMAKCYSNVSSAFGELGDSKKAIVFGEKALSIFIKKKMIPYQVITLPNLAGEFLKLGDTTMGKTYFMQAEELAKQRNDKFSLARIYNNLGNMYLETNTKKSEEYLLLALKYKNETRNNDGIAILYNNLGYLMLQKNDPEKAISYLKNALPHSSGTNIATTYNNLSDAYIQTKNYQSALKYTQLKNKVSDSISNIENQKAIAEISTKYETEKKEREILNLQNKNLQIDIERRQNRNLLYIAIGLIFIGLISAYGFIKNSRKKRVIAEQQKELEQQKVEKLLKEQELVGIDAMLDGQEKERQRIAQDLHDSLGGKLSALKLFVENMKEKDEVLYEKIKSVLDDSYNDVRNISHQNHVTSMIDNGLIPAVNKVAERLKSTEKLNVEVTNIDLRQKIKTFIEIQLFRIIQELITNTIKHAKAKNVTIQFSEEEDLLNVVYEDDGIGFDINKLSQGIGFSNIKNRIEKINAVITYDSGFDNGTTVIINVPL